MIHCYKKLKLSWEQSSTLCDINHFRSHSSYLFCLVTPSFVPQRPAAWPKMIKEFWQFLTKAKHGVCLTFLVYRYTARSNVCSNSGLARKIFVLQRVAKCPQQLAKRKWRRMCILPQIRKFSRSAMRKEYWALRLRSTTIITVNRTRISPLPSGISSKILKNWTNFQEI